jgi:hypothetical protein
MTRELTIAGVDEPPCTSPISSLNVVGSAAGSRIKSHSVCATILCSFAIAELSRAEADSIGAMICGENLVYTCEPYTADDTSNPLPILPCAAAWHTCARLCTIRMPERTSLLLSVLLLLLLVVVLSGTLKGSATTLNVLSKHPTNDVISAAELPIPVLATTTSPSTASKDWTVRITV